jgi:hypothetical protein
MHGLFWCFAVEWLSLTAGSTAEPHTMPTAAAPANVETAAEPEGEQ